jgi:hypothetical protein
MTAPRVPPTAAEGKRISLLDPLAVRDWCAELQCTELELRAAVYAVGSAPDEVRRYFDRGQKTPAAITG